MNQISQIPRARRQVAKPRDEAFKVVIICNCDSPDYESVLQAYQHTATIFSD